MLMTDFFDQLSVYNILLVLYLATQQIKVFIQNYNSKNELLIDVINRIYSVLISST